MENPWARYQKWRRLKKLAKHSYEAYWYCPAGQVYENGSWLLSLDERDSFHHKEVESLFEQRRLELRYNAPSRFASKIVYLELEEAKSSAHNNLRPSKYNIQNPLYHFYNVQVYAVEDALLDHSYFLRSIEIYRSWELGKISSDQMKTQIQNQADYYWQWYHKDKDNSYPEWLVERAQIISLIPPEPVFK